MGVPALYRWLVDKYPLVAAEVMEEEPIVMDGIIIPVDSSTPNPNKIEYDNLYLDITGIIYLILHPEDRQSPVSYDQVFQCIFDYIDRLFLMVRPRKLIYMAIDGVVPRAKMNEQRCRRFRAAKHAADAAAVEEKLRREFESAGKKLPAKNFMGLYFSHLIAPGTEFMAAVSDSLKYYIHLKLNYDAGWKGIKVILSDANVPGEGEHKIMSYIRLQRNLSGYDPNTRHCVYGLDADLITLALATHEVHLSILRNVVSADCKAIGKRKAGNVEVGARKQYEFLHIWRLREYLEYEMRIQNSPIMIDFERTVDDFVFMCLFLGNDFLPCLPSLEIREDAINLLLTVYKKELIVRGDYLTYSGKPNLSSVEYFIHAIGSYEDNIFQKRAHLKKIQAEKIRGEKAENKREDVSQRQVQPQSLVTARFQASVDCVRNEMYGNKNELKRKLKELLREKSDTFSSDNLKEDRVKLGEQGWKERYYAEKFSASTREEVDAVRNDVVAKYVEGLCWVTHYYYEGVCSWKWFYPYHYAPFASDLKDLGQLNISFEMGSPFKPFTQMLGISPAASSRALPKEYRKLMIDPNSPIIDFYPTDFEIDQNGMRYTWQGIAKLPFIDEARLLTEVAKIEHTLTDAEVQRNSVTLDILFVSSVHKLYPYLSSLHDRCKQLERNIEDRLDPGASIGMNGNISPSGDPCPQIFRSPIQGKEDIVDNQVIWANYRLPEAHKHVTRLPIGVIFPQKTVTIEQVKSNPLLWHEEDSELRLEKERQSKSEPVLCHEYSRATTHMENGRHNHKPIAAHPLLVNGLHLWKQMI